MSINWNFFLQDIYYFDFASNHDPNLLLLKYKSIENGYCDEEVPSELSDEYITLIDRAEESEDWILIESRSYGNQIIRRQWISFDTQSRLCFFKFEEGASIIILESLIDDMFIMVGERVGHPFVYTSTFIYENSDGSAADYKTKTAELAEIFKHLKHNFITYCNDDDY